MDVEALTAREVELQKEHDILEQQIADLGFRRAAVRGAILEVRRMRALATVAAETPAEANGHSG